MALALAEHSNAFTPLAAGEQRLEDPRFTIWLGRSRSPWSTVVQRLRLEGEDVAGVLAEVRDVLGRLDRRGAQWEVSSSATPADLVDRLLALGLVPDREPLAVAMVLDAPPPPGPPGVSVARVETLADYAASQEIAFTAFEAPEAARAAARGRLATDFAALAASPATDLWLARLDGEPVASGRATYAAHGVVLNSGATLPHARGRGAYRALVAARWREAERRGTPALITQAGALSRPILSRLGFRDVAEIRILLDEW